MKIKKLIALTLISMLSLSSFTGCGNDDTSEKTNQENKLVVYSPNSEGLVNAIIPLFEEKTGIKVELQQAGTGELFTKLKGEAQDPVADVIWGGSYTTYLDNEGLFDEYVSPEDKNLPEAYQNKSKFKTSYVLDGSCIIVNKDLIGDIKIEGYKDLLNPALKGKIASADPSNSSSAFSHLTNMLLAMGGYDNDTAWKYVEDLYKNIDGKISGSSSAVYKSVIDGEMVVGLSYEDPVAKVIKDGAKNIEIIYMNEGTVYLPAGSAIIKNAKHKENAKKFIDFIISKEAQDVLGKTTTNRPVLPNAETGSFMKPMKDIKVITEDYDYVYKNSGKIRERFKELFAKIQSR